MIELQRLDLYRPIHKALRLLMAETLVEVGRLDCEDSPELHAGLDRVEQLLRACRSHLQHEDAFLHPALERLQRNGAERTHHDHLEHRHAIDALQRQVTAVRERVGGARQQAADALYDALADFIGENFAHMRIEERDNNARLWSGYDDAALVEVHEALLASIPASEMEDTLRLMARALSPRERAGLLGEIRGKMPADAFSALLGGLLPLLPPRDRAKLGIALGEARVAA